MKPKHTRESLKNLIKDKGWKCSWNRQEFKVSETEELRSIIVQIKVPEVRVRTRALERSFMKELIKELGTKWIDVGVGELTNEDGGDWCTLNQSFNIPVRIG